MFPHFLTSEEGKYFADILPRYTMPTYDLNQLGHLQNDTIIIFLWKPIKKKMKHSSPDTWSLIRKGVPNQ